MGIFKPIVNFGSSSQRFLGFYSKYVTTTNETTATNPLYSSDSGNTFNTSSFTGTTPRFNRVAFSSDGKFQFVAGGLLVNNNPRTIAVSTDYGVNFSQPTGTTNANYLEVACSKDGKYVLSTSFGVNPANGRINSIIKSSDSGTTFTNETIGGAITASGNTYPSACAISSDGKIQYIGGSTLLSYTWSAISTDYGVTFTYDEPGTTQFYTTPTNACMSDNGKYILYSRSGLAGYQAFVLSSNTGTTFSVVYSATTDVNAVCMSSTGEYMYGQDNKGIIRSTDYGVSWYYVEFLSSTLPVNSRPDIKCSSNGEYVYLLADEYFWFSYDYGATWARSNNSYAAQYFNISLT